MHNKPTAEKQLHSIRDWLAIAIDAVTLNKPAVLRACLQEIQSRSFLLMQAIAEDRKPVFDIVAKEAA